MQKLHNKILHSPEHILHKLSLHEEVSILFARLKIYKTVNFACRDSDLKTLILFSEKQK